ncbi:hypothetical protein Hanom_Chr01g00085031 [Helianthus anomalus]
MFGPGLPELFLVPVSFGPGTFNGQDPPLNLSSSSDIITVFLIIFFSTIISSFFYSHRFSFSLLTPTRLSILFPIIASIFTYSLLESLPSFVHLSFAGVT